MSISRPALGFGAGLRAEHYADVESAAGSEGIEWFEAITENYLDTSGRPLAVLERIRRDYPVTLHGVGLSIAAAEPTDPRYLSQLERLVDRIEPTLVTDHLCWTGLGSDKIYDLLPIPYTEETLRYVAGKVRIVQDALGRQIALENPSRYVDLTGSTMAEEDFLAALAVEADCGLLLDVNNVYVTASNLGFDPERYIDALPVNRVVQIHLAGFTDMGSYLFDTHSAPVHGEVWRLYTRALRRFGGVATMVEWDADIPSYERLTAEVAVARDLARDSLEIHDADRNTRSPRAALRDSSRACAAHPRAAAA